MTTTPMGRAGSENRKWFGHGRLRPPDTEINRPPPGAAQQVVGPGAARHRQGATRPTYLGWPNNNRQPKFNGRRTTGKGIGVNTHHCVSISDRMAGWPSTPVIRVTN